MDEIGWTLHNIERRGEWTFAVLRWAGEAGLDWQAVPHAFANAEIRIPITLDPSETLQAVEQRLLALAPKLLDTQRLRAWQVHGREP